MASSSLLSFALFFCFLESSKLGMLVDVKIIELLEPLFSRRRLDDKAVAARLA